MRSNIDAILFDLDDTILVELKSAEESFIETIRQIESGINSDQFLKTIRKKAKENWYKLPTIDYCLKIGISSREGLWADFTGDGTQLAKLRELSAGYRFDTWNQTLIEFNITNEKLAERLSRDFKRIRNTKHILFPESIYVLQKLQGKFKLGLITNGTPELQWKKIKGGGLKKYFQSIAIAGEHGYAKPDRRLFEVAIKGIGSGPDNTVMIGDSLHTDIKGGRECGLRSIWVNRDGEKADAINPDFEINNLSAIFDVITKLNDTRQLL
jgi:putative hydrolase of the HAD superfamily